MGCVFEKYPCCAIQTIVSAIDIDSMFENGAVKGILYPVCHNNAQLIVDNKIIKNNSCDDCMLCDVICPSSNTTDTICINTEKIALGNLNRLNILLKNMLPNTLVATEVKAKGNAREKRVDLVIRKDKHLFVGKVLSDIDRYSFYKRSYEEITDYYAKKYEDYSIYIFMLLSSTRMDLARSKGLACKTINEMVREIMEV